MADKKKEDELEENGEGLEETEEDLDAEVDADPGAVRDALVNALDAVDVGVEGEVTAEPMYAQLKEGQEQASQIQEDDAHKRELERRNELAAKGIFPRNVYFNPENEKFYTTDKSQADPDNGIEYMEKDPLDKRFNPISNSYTIVPSNYMFGIADIGGRVPVKTGPGSTGVRG